MVDRDNRLQKVIVNDRLVREARRCVEAWRSLQELGGVHNSHARHPGRTRTQSLGGAGPAGGRGEAGRCRERAEATGGAGGGCSCRTQPLPKRRPKNRPDEPYIETARCTTCNECTQINDKMFGYDANKQASIINPDAGTYRQLVEAAESCQVSIIHPGKPRNPNEPGLDELMKRAEPFL